MSLLQLKSKFDGFPLFLRYIGGMQVVIFLTQSGPFKAESALGSLHRAFDHLILIMFPVTITAFQVFDVSEIGIQSGLPQYKDGLGKVLESAGAHHVSRF